MPTRHLCLAALLIPAAAVAQDGTDRYGDPLPAGAVARLGTDRGWWAVGWGNNSRLAADGRVLLRSGNGRLLWIDPAIGREGSTKAVWGEDRDGTGDPVSLTPDGRRGVFSWNDHARVYDLATGKRLATIPAETGVNPRSAVISADGTLVAVGQVRLGAAPPKDGVHAIVWSVTDDSQCAKIKLAESGLATVHLTPDGKTLLTRVPPAGYTPKPPPESLVMTVWDAGTGKRLGQLQAEGAFDSIVFAPDSSVGAVWSGAGNAVEVFDPRTGKRLHTLKDSAAGSGPLAFSRDGKTLLLVDGQSLKAVAWDVATGRRSGVIDPPKDLPPRGWVRAVTFTPGGKAVAWGVWDQHVALAWDPLAGAPITPALRHVGRVNAVGFTADSKYLVSTDDAGENIRWEVATGKPVGRVTIATDPGSKPDVVKTSPDAAVGYSVRAAYDLASGKKLSALPDGLNFSHPSLAVRPLAGGRVVLLPRAGYERNAPCRCVVWDAAAGGASLDTKLPYAPPGFGGEYSVAVTPGGETLAVMFVPEAKPGAARLTAVAAFDAKGKAMWDRTFEGDSGDVRAAPDGKSFAATVRGRVEVLDAATGKSTGRFGGNESRLSSLVFTPDGRKCVVSASVYGKNGEGRVDLEVRSWPDGEVLAAVPSQGARPDLVSPDGRVLASCGAASVVLWDLTTWPKPGTPSAKPRPGADNPKP